ncbi:hypothetical protein Pyn_32288 [Prunus yedoensis var. nudiflora]|uniref:Uncharacterized protein n=1 Tax=Prunus yedoensis var. nudiflora TaxID=2094558 RepID=A0A314ZCW2_PRUYE|nr:hypothetical protein Pyn_32288 [Prunus yedoensis var. nudiflora]
MCKLLLFIMTTVVVVILIGVLFGLGPFDRIRHYHLNQKLSLDFCDPNHNGYLSCRNNGTEKPFLDSKSPPASKSLLKPRMSFDQGGSGDDASDVDDGSKANDEAREEAEEEVKQKSTDF